MSRPAESSRTGGKPTAGAARYKPYPAYKDSGVEWLGEIPVHWQIAPVYARYDVALGKMLDAKRISGDFSGRYVRNIDVQWGSVNMDDLPRMDFLPQERERYALKPGDLLICEGGEVGRTAIWPGDSEECFYQKAIHRVRPRSRRDVPRFFYYVMYSLAIRDVFLAGSNPNTIDHLTAVQLRHYRLLFPPSDEQCAIASYLDRETAKIDALVSKKERLIELLQEKRSALITHAVTKGLDPDVPMKDSGVEWLGEIPAHWATKRLSQICEILRGKFTHRPRNDPELYDGDYPFIQTGDVARARKEITCYRQTLNERGLGVSKMFPSGTLVMTIAANVGDVAVLNFPACFPDSIVGFIPRSEIARDFLYYVFLAVKPEMLREAPVNTQGNLNVERIGSIGGGIPVPSKLEQRTIADFLDGETTKIDTLIAKIHEAIDHLKELRTALISAAVTGQIDVRKAAA